MLLKTLKFIEKHSLFTKETKILLAVSGGMDSMALLYLLHKSGFNISVAHVNYKLRANESDLDEQLILDFCRQNNIDFYPISYNTKSYCTQHKIGIQEAARILRYEWFDQLSTNYDFEAIITAHHLNDNVETSLHHFSRGSGLDGIKAMLPENGPIKRPLIEHSRAEIHTYVRLNHIKYREDQSNLSRDYTRNKLRHEIIPKLNEIFPNFDATSKSTLANLRQVWEFYHDKMDLEKTSVCSFHKETLVINKFQLFQKNNAQLILYEILHSYSFHSNTIDKIYKSAIDSSGQAFHTNTHTLTIERDEIVLEPKHSIEWHDYTIEDKSTTNTQVGTFSILNYDDKIELNKNSVLVYLDEMDFPLTIRKWKDGDQFMPLGMNGASKKIKKYLANIKIDHRLKKQQLVITNYKNIIIWVVGLRLDHRFGIHKNRLSRVISWTPN